MKSKKNNLIVLIIMQLLFQINCLGMENIYINKANELAKKIFGVFDPESKINLKDFGSYESKELREWVELLSKIAAMRVNVKTQDLKCLLIDPINEDRCSRVATKENKDTQILTIYDLNQALFVMLKDLFGLRTSEQIKYNLKLLDYITNFSSDLKKISNFLKSIKLQDSGTDEPLKKIIENLIKIYEAILDKIRIDFGPSGQKLIKATDEAYEFVFAKSGVNEKFNDLQKASWKNLVINIQRLVFVSGVESLICVAQNPSTRCKTKDGKDIYTIFDLSVNFITGSDELSALYKREGANAHDTYKKIYDSSERGINQIETIIKEAKISNNIFGQSAKNVLENLMKKFRLLLQKLEVDFGYSKDSVIKSIDTKIKEIFAGDLSVFPGNAAQVNRNKSWDELLYKVGLFIKASDPDDSSNIYEGNVYVKVKGGRQVRQANVKERLASIFDFMSISTDKRGCFGDPTQVCSTEPLKYFDEHIYKTIATNLAQAKKLINDISFSIRTKPREAKAVLEHLVKKMDGVVAKFKSDWEKYLKSIKK